MLTHKRLAQYAVLRGADAHTFLSDEWPMEKVTSLQVSTPPNSLRMLQCSEECSYKELFTAST